MTNKKSKIICISGKARSGKDEFAKIAIEYLNENYPQLKVQRLGYGDWVKDVCHRYFNCTYVRDDYNRTQWQQIGTEKGRFNHPDIWVNMTIDLVKGIFSDYDYIFISDCRFLNELQRWEKEGFEVTTIRIRRTGFDNGLTKEQKNHASETSLDYYNFDYYINNYYSLELYKEMVINCVENEMLD
jgi:hypothetical protein